MARRGAGAGARKGVAETAGAEVDGTTNARRRLEACSNQSRGNGGATAVAAAVERSRDRRRRERSAPGEAWRPGGTSGKWGAHERHDECVDKRLCVAAGRVVEEAGRLYVAKDRPRVYVKLILITHSNGNILAVMVANNLVARRDQLWMACHHLRSNKLR